MNAVKGSNTQMVHTSNPGLDPPTLSIYNRNLIIASLCHRADGTVFPLQRMFTFSAAKPTTPFCSAACHHIIRCSGSDDSKPSNRCATAGLGLFVFDEDSLVLGKFLNSQLQGLLLWTIQYTVFKTLMSLGWKSVLVVSTMLEVLQSCVVNLPNIMWGLGKTYRNEIN